MRTSRAFTLIEMNLAVVLVGVVALVLGSFYLLLARSFGEIRIRNRATHIASGVIEEIRCRRWDETTGAKSAPGIDTGETAGNKTTFDDIDDFNGYSEAPPRYRDGTAMPGLAGFSVHVAVSYVNEDLAIVTGATTVRKKISVTVRKDNVDKATLATISGQKLGF